MFSTDALIGYFIVFAIIIFAYYESIKKQNNIKKTCTDFYNCYLKFSGSCYPAFTNKTISTDENGILPLENQPVEIHNIIETAMFNNVNKQYIELKNSYVQVAVSSGKSSKNNKNYAYPLLQVLNSAEAFAVGCMDFSLLNTEESIENFNIFLSKQDSIKHILEQRIITQK